MPRQPTGQVLERQRTGGIVFALRVRAYGERHYVTLGSEADGWTRTRADDELAYVLQQIARGVWVPPQDTPAPAEPKITRDPTFREFATAWFEDKARAVSASTATLYRGHLTDHVLPFFADHPLSAITVAEVDRYRAWKVRQGKLSPDTINKTIRLLGAVLDVAEERGQIARNPVRVNPRNRLLKVTRKRPVWLDTAEQITALLDAAQALDASHMARTSGRRPLLATLVFGGLRVTEACRLRWRDVDLANGRLTTGSKTDAGHRQINLLPALRDELLDHRATAVKAGTAGPDAPVFPTGRGGWRDKDNVRVRVLAPAVEKADELLAARGHIPLPQGVTPHKLRHSFASALIACGEDPAYVMGQLGHTDPKFTLRVYTHGMQRDAGARERLKALVTGGPVDSTTTTPTSRTASIGVTAYD